VSVPSARPSSRRLVDLGALLLLLILLASCSGRDTSSELLAIRQAEDRRDPGDGFLSRDLSEGTKPVRAAAARALGRIGDPLALEPLLHALRRENDPEVRAEIAFALGILGKADAVPALLQALDSEPDAYTSSEIAIALGRIGGDTSLDALHGLLRSQWGLIRERAIEALALIADDRSIDPLVDRLEDRDPGVAWRAAYALEKIPGDRQVPALVALLANSPDPMLVRAAVRTLGRLEAEAAIDPLANLASTPHDDWQLDVRIADALGRIGTNRPPAVNTVGGLLASNNFHVQVAALQAVGRARWRDLLPSVLDLRTSETVDVRAAAFDAIADCLDGRTSELLTPGLDDPSPLVAATCLRRLGESVNGGVIDLLVTAVNNEQNRILRLGAAEGLAAAGDRVPLDEVVALIDDHDPFVATTAASALGTRGNGQAVAPLMAALERSEAGIIDLRVAAATSLGQLGDERAVGILRTTMAQAPETRLRVAARDALAEILPPEQTIGLPDEEEIRDDVRPIVRAAGQPDLVARSTATELILHTDRGKIRIELLNEDAPQMVESFARLADSGFFDGLTFHRVVGDFVVQGGDPTGTGWGDAGYTLRSEWNPRRYGRGTVGIAHSGKDTGSCQLFITQSPQPHLDARYTVWGEVSEGMEVVDRIQRGDRFRAEVVRSAR
jgi:HEAT repeat protein